MPATLSADAQAQDSATANNAEDILHRCAILDDYQNVALSFADWAPVAEQAEVSVFDRHISDRKLLVETLQPFDIIVAMRERTPFDAELVGALPKLRLLVTTGMRNRSIDLEACAKHGITVCGTGGVPGSTAELAWGLILALARGIPAEAADFREGRPWQPRIGRDLAGARLGVLGFGRLGARVARVGVAFGMDVYAWTPNLTDERVREVGAMRAASLDELLQTADFLSIHIPLNAATRGLIGARELGLMKPSACLVNTSRGPIVDDSALIDALNGQRLAGAAVDVFAEEPLPADHPMRKVERLIGTPHIGYVTQDTYAIFYRDAVEDIVAWLAGSPMRVLSAG